MKGEHLHKLLRLTQHIRFGPAHHMKAGYNEGSSRADLESPLRKGGQGFESPRLHLRGRYLELLGNFEGIRFGGGECFQ